MKYRRVPIDGDALVVAFDMCSSSDILEELTLSGDLWRYDQLLTSVKEHLATAQEAVLFDPYKFTGDGWILLFPKETDGELVFKFLRNLCRFFKRELQDRVLRHLASPPSITGLTFGLEKGPLRAMTMYGQKEYIGRALNVACRLQGRSRTTTSHPRTRRLSRIRRTSSTCRRRALTSRCGRCDARCGIFAVGRTSTAGKIELLNERAT